MPRCSSGFSTTLTLLAVGLGATGAIAFGAALAMLGVLFAAVTATAAQVSASARGALGIAGLVVGATFVVRGIGAMADNWLVWLSPFGWAQEIQAYGDEQWWTLGILLIASVAAFATAAYLTAHRDAGAGLLYPRPGDPRASRTLGTSAGLSLRLQRGLILGWGLGLVALAALYGSVVVEVPDLLESIPEMEDLFGAGQTLIDGFLAYIYAFLATVTSAFAISSVLRLRAEEGSMRAEMVLATAVPRWRWAAGLLLMTALATIALVLGIGLAVGATYAVTDSDWSHLWPAVGAALAQLPAVLVMPAFAFGVWAWTRTAWGWLLFGFAMLQTMLGELLKFPDWLNGVSPFWHLPAVPADSFELTPVLALLAVAAAFTAAGFWGLQRRDIVAGA